MNQSGLPTPPPTSTTSTTNPAQSSSNTAGQSASDISLGSIVATINSTSNPSQLNQYLRSCASKDVREVLLASILPGNQDPLTLLNVRDHTLGILYILWVSLIGMFHYAHRSFEGLRDCILSRLIIHCGTTSRVFAAISSLNMLALLRIEVSLSLLTC
jgi:hypothetical protein